MTIEVGTEQVAVVAEVAVGSERDRLLGLMAEHARQLLGFQAAAGRVIAVVVLVPTTPSFA